MERPIGDKFKLNGCVYVVVEDTACSLGDLCANCAFNGGACTSITDVRGECTISSREDMKAVHFEHFGVDW